MPVPRQEPTRRLPPGRRRAALLEALRANGGAVAVSDLAPAVGLHPNTVRAHLDVLVRSGQVTRRTDARNTPGRPRELYQAVVAVTDDRNYQLLAAMLASHLDETTEDAASVAADAGRAWSARHRPGEPRARPSGVGPVLELLSSSGFAPQLSPDGAAIELHHCPFRELAQEHPGVVCGAHLGLIQGALQTSEADVSATRILPFVEPSLCLAELSPRSAG